MISTPHSTFAPQQTIWAIAAAALIALGAAACAHPAAASPALTPPRPTLTSSGPARPGTPTPAAADLAAAGSACALVSAAQVAAVTGQQMRPGTDGGTICYYSAANDPSVVVYVQTYSDTSAMATPKSIESGSQHLPGLGDDAFWNPGIIFVQKGSRGFTITVPSLAFKAPKASTTMITLATAAAAKL